MLGAPEQTPRNGNQFAQTHGNLGRSEFFESRSALGQSEKTLEGAQLESQAIKKRIESIASRLWIGAGGHVTRMGGNPLKEI